MTNEERVRVATVDETFADSLFARHHSVWYVRIEHRVAKWLVDGVNCTGRVEVFN